MRPVILMALSLTSMTALANEGGTCGSGVNGTDLDGDGWCGEASGGLDCDDADPDVSPAALDDVCDGIDANCDGADCQTSTNPVPVTELYTYKIHLYNTATARTYKIYFRCAGVVTTRTVAGSSTENEYFQCTEPPASATSNPDIQVKMKAKVASSWERAAIQVLYGWNNFTGSVPASNEGWVDWQDLAMPATTSNSSYDQKACFYSWEYFGMYATNEECS